MKEVYRYYTPFRPPMPGAVPRDGLDRVGCYDTRQSVGNGIRIRRVHQTPDGEGDQRL